MKTKMLFVFIVSIFLIVFLILVGINGSGSANSKYKVSVKVTGPPAFIDKTADNLVAGGRKWKLVYSDQS